MMYPHDVRRQRLVRLHAAEVLVAALKSGTGRWIPPIANDWRDTGWLSFLDGKDPEYPDRTLAQEFLAIRSHIDGLRADRTTPHNTPGRRSDGL